MNNEVKAIIACSDVHIRNLRRIDEYQIQLSKFIDECKAVAKQYGNEHIRIVIAGDLLHNKLDISGEGYTMAAWFLRQLDKIAKTIVIAGNHDMNMNNLSRVDPITTIFSMSKFERVYFLDKELSYSSGCIVDENIVWCLYSSFDGFAQPNIVETKIENPDATYVGLFHGDLKDVKTNTGYLSPSGLDPSYFEGVNFCIMGHIHKRQCVTHNGAPLVYCGSLIQQDHGENVSEHGYVLWDVNEETFEFKDIPNPDYGYYTVTITSEDDIDLNKEEFINL